MSDKMDPGTVTLLVIVRLLLHSEQVLASNNKTSSTLTLSTFSNSASSPLLRSSMTPRSSHTVIPKASVSFTPEQNPLFSVMSGNVVHSVISASSDISHSTVAPSSISKSSIQNNSLDSRVNLDTRVSSRSVEYTPITLYTSITVPHISSSSVKAVSIQASSSDYFESTALHPTPWISYAMTNSIFDHTPVSEIPFIEKSTTPIKTSPLMTSNEEMLSITKAPEVTINEEPISARTESNGANPTSMMENSVVFIESSMSVAKPTTDFSLTTSSLDSIVTYAHLLPTSTSASAISVEPSYLPTGSLLYTSRTSPSSVIQISFNNIPHTTSVIRTDSLPIEPTSTSSSSGTSVHNASSAAVSSLTSTKTAAITLSNSTTTSPDSYIKPAGRSIEIPMELSVNDNFTQELADHTTASYIMYKLKFKSYLKELYQNLPGLASISVTGFRSGSVIAEYVVAIDAASGIHKALQDVDKIIQKNLNNTTLAQRHGLQVETTKTLRLVASNLQAARQICSLYTQPCPFGYICTSKSMSMLSCTSKCSTKLQPCGQNGECFINHMDESPVCRCKEDDTHVYSGQHCEVATEKLKLESKYIIIIGASGGAVVLIIVVILVVCLVRSWNRKAKRDIVLNDRHKSLSMTDLHSFASYDGQRSRTQTIDDLYDSGLPDPNDREQRWKRGSVSGSEFYIYSPSSFATSENPLKKSEDIDQSNRRSGRTESVFNEIDTENKFEIRRPTIVTTSISKM